MNPAFGLGKLLAINSEKNMNRTYLTLGLAFRMRSIAALASRLCEYIMYAAATVALRPVMCEPQLTYYMRRNSLVPA
jgi:hypothetical protein